MTSRIGAKGGTFLRSFSHVAVLLGASTRVMSSSRAAVADMHRFRLTDTCVLQISKGDLTEWEGDAIVNAANERMLGGGGVDGAIHRAAGPRLFKACKDYPADRGVRCPTGEARITPGFDLPAAWVIHTVGPVYESDRASPPLLEAAYRSSLKVANDEKYNIRTVAFPAISCGVYGYPWDKAAVVSLRTCAEHAGALDEIHFVLFSENMVQTYLDAAEASFERVPSQRDAADADSQGSDVSGSSGGVNEPRLQREGPHGESGAAARSGSAGRQTPERSEL